MRLFFGATLPDKTKDEIVRIEEMMRPHFPNAKFEGADKLHITLQFIGEFGRDVSELFSAALVELGKCDAKSPVTETGGVSYFPNDRTRRGIWLECRDDGTLSSLALALSNASAKFGVESEKRVFKPHITLARLKQDIGRRGERYYNRGSNPHVNSGNVPDLQKLTVEGKLSVERFFPKSVALFESTLKPSGSEYRILKEYSLE